MAFAYRTLIADAQERGSVARNVVRDLRGRRRRGEFELHGDEGRVEAVDRSARNHRPLNVRAGLS